MSEQVDLLCLPSIRMPHTPFFRSHALLIAPPPHTHSPWTPSPSSLQVSEQVDSLRVLFTDPVDYLVTPRVLASMIAGPLLNVLCFCMGGWGGRS